MEDKKLYKIAVSSKEEFRKFRFLLRAIGHDFDDYVPGSISFIYKGKSNSAWRTTSTSEECLSSLGYKTVELKDILDDIIKALPKPKKEKPFPVEEVMKQMADNSTVHPFTETAVRVKNELQLVHVLRWLSLPEDDIAVITSTIGFHASFDDLCVSIDKPKVSIAGDAKQEDTLNMGTQKYFRDLQYYIMEYNNFNRKIS